MLSTICGSGAARELSRAHGDVGAARTDFEQGRNAAGVVVEVVVQLYRRLSTATESVTRAHPRDEHERGRTLTALMTCVSGAMVCSRVAKSD